MEKVNNFLEQMFKEEKTKNKELLSGEEKTKIINERYKFIKKESLKLSKEKQKVLKLDKKTRDQVTRKIMRSSTQELAVKGFNALLDEMFNNKKDKKC